MTSTHYTFTLTGEIVSGVPNFELPPFSVDASNTTKQADFTEMVAQLGSSLVSVPLVGILGCVAISKSFGELQD